MSDLDISVIDELPPGENQFKRCIVWQQPFEEVWKFAYDERF
jgi:RecG-like helicase